MPSIQLLQVHTSEQAADIIRAAMQLTVDLDVDESWKQAVFGKAVDLLAVRIPIQPMPALDLSGLNLGPRL